MLLRVHAPEPCAVGDPYTADQALLPLAWVSVPVSCLPQELLVTVPICPLHSAQFPPLRG